jgi:hypothetical protein
MPATNKARINFLGMLEDTGFGTGCPHVTLTFDLEIPSLLLHEAYHDRIMAGCIDRIFTAHDKRIDMEISQIRYFSRWA